MKKWFLSIAVFSGSLVLTAACGLVVGLFVAGPHSDLLPEILRIPAGLAIWIAILGIPVWLASKVFSRYAQKEKQG